MRRPCCIHRNKSYNLQECTRQNDFSLRKTNNLTRKFYKAYLSGVQFVYGPFGTKILLNSRLKSYSHQKHMTNSSKPLKEILLTILSNKIAILYNPQKIQV